MNEPKRAVRVGQVKPITLSRTIAGNLRLSICIPHPQLEGRTKYVKLAEWYFHGIDSMEQLEAAIRYTVQQYADKTRHEFDVSRMMWDWLPLPEQLQVRFEA